MTDNEKLYLLYGFILGLARAAKDDGLFQDLTMKQVANLYIASL